MTTVNWKALWEADRLELVRALDTLDAVLPELARAAEAAARSIDGGGTILLFGNGGSAADAQHVAAELVNRFLRDRRALPAVALTTDSSVITSIANDFGYDQIFSRQIEALGRPGDLAFGISTSGRSPNVVAALAAARRRGLVTVALTGPAAGAAGDQADIVIAVPGASTPVVQAFHLILEHLFCRLVEDSVAP
jgi:D-sedoheptulose 7-phosphate isomerase